MMIRDTTLKFLLALGLCCALQAQAAAPRQSIRAIEAQVGRLLRAQTAGLPGEVRLRIGKVDPRLDLPACSSAPQAFVPPGARLWGSTSVGVRCTGSRPWQIYVPVTVRVLGRVVIANRPLAAGRRIARGDLSLQQADLTQLPASVVTRPAQAVGSVLTIGIGAGQPLRLDVLRAPAVIHRGQTVVLRTRGPGFRVSSQGRALANAAVGALAPVRVASGRIISGTARPGGIVEIQY